MSITTCSTIRATYSRETVKLDTQLEKGLAVTLFSDSSRLLELNGPERVLLKTLRAVRSKPEYREIDNFNEPLTYPDGSLMVNTELTFTLVTKDGQIGSVVDMETGDTVNNMVTVYTDRFGEFSVRLWPNTRSNVQSAYLLTTDSRFLNDKPLLYVAESPNPLKFSTMLKNKFRKYPENIVSSLGFTIDVPASPAYSGFSLTVNNQ